MKDRRQHGRQHQGERRRETSFEELVKKSSDGMVVLDRERLVRFMNPAAERMLGKRLEDLSGSGFPYPVGQDTELVVRDLEGQPAWLEAVSCRVNWKGDDACLLQIRDVTDRKCHEERLFRKLKAADMLIREVHHRVKNDLQGVVSVMGMQAASLQNPDVRNFCRNNQARLAAVAQIHGILSRQDPSVMSLRDLAGSLGGYLLELFNARGRIRLEIDAADLLLDPGISFSCGLILNELITNCLKHAFPGQRGGTIVVHFSRYGDDMILGVRDDGTGISSEVARRMEEGGATFGLQLVTCLVEEMHGVLEIGSRGGTEIIVRFRERPETVPSSAPPLLFTDATLPERQPGG